MRLILFVSVSQVFVLVYVAVIFVLTLPQPTWTLTVWIPLALFAVIFEMTLLDRKLAGGVVKTFEFWYVASTLLLTHVVGVYLQYDVRPMADLIITVVGSVCGVFFVLLLCGLGQAILVGVAIGSLGKTVTAALEQHDRPFELLGQHISATSLQTGHNFVVLLYLLNTRF
jgi:hypothetical protein